MGLQSLQGTCCHSSIQRYVKDEMAHVHNFIVRKILPLMEGGCVVEKLGSSGYEDTYCHAERALGIFINVFSL